MTAAFLGTNFGHGSSTAIATADRGLVFALEEGKVTGVKETANFPFESISKIDDNLKIIESYEGWNIYKRFWYKGMLQSFVFGARDPFYFSHRLQKEYYRFIEGITQFRLLRNQLSLNDSHFTGHHLAHAYSLLPAGLPPQSLVLVSDTTAEYESVSVYHWDGASMRRLAYAPYPHSIGSVFHQLASHLGFKGRNAPGTLMALASWGQPVWFDECWQFNDVDAPVFRVNTRIYPCWKIADTWKLYAEWLKPSAFRTAIHEARHTHEAGKDLAASMQQWFTEATWLVIRKMIHHARVRHGLTVNHLGLVGGSALNCQANGIIHRRLTELDCERLIVSPWSDDTGTSIGAAVHGLFTHTGIRDIPHPGPFLGHVPEIIYSKHVDADLEIAAQALANGHIIALVSGSLEFGPRALGGRCILANPMLVSARDRLNQIKGRYAFMPFAPAVLASSYPLYFYDEASSIMAWTVRAKASALQDIPAAVHADGTARVQLVMDADSTLLAKLLLRFREKTGIGALLLTSLNGKNEPFNYLHQDAVNTSQKLTLYGTLSDTGWVFNA